MRDVTLGMRDQERGDAGARSLSDEAAAAHHAQGSSPVPSGHCCVRVISGGVPP